MRNGGNPSADYVISPTFAVVGHVTHTLNHTFLVMVEI